MDVTIDAMSPADWPEVAAIFAEGIASRNATFETSAPTWEAWDAAHRPERLVAREGGRVLGWAALSPYSSRRVYAGVAELGIYVAEVARGRGVGRVLLTALIDLSERSGVWTLQAGVFPENTASLSLHRRCGFREVGRRERIGFEEVWRDVILLERRSRTVGVGTPAGKRASG